MNSTAWGRPQRSWGSATCAAAPWCAAAITPKCPEAMKRKSAPTLHNPVKQGLALTHHQLPCSAPDQTQRQIGRGTAQDPGGTESQSLEITHQTAMLLRVIVNGQQASLTAGRFLEPRARVAAQTRAPTPAGALGCTRMVSSCKPPGSATRPTPSSPPATGPVHHLRVATTKRNVQNPSDGLPASAHQSPLPRLLLQLLKRGLCHHLDGGIGSKHR